jgi:hypothetical protein
MCREEGHSLKDCPKTKAFIMKKVLKILNKGYLVQLDGTNLPCGDINNGGVQSWTGKSDNFSRV